MPLLPPMSPLPPPLFLSVRSPSVPPIPSALASSPTSRPTHSADSHGSLNLAVVMSFCSCCLPFALKGGMPHSISKSSTPTLHQSTALPWPRPAMISGACRGQGGRKGG